MTKEILLIILKIDYIVLFEFESLFKYKFKYSMKFERIIKNLLNLIFCNYYIYEIKMRNNIIVSILLNDFFSANLRCN